MPEFRRGAAGLGVRGDRTKQTVVEHRDVADGSRRHRTGPTVRRARGTGPPPRRRGCASHRGSRSFFRHRPQSSARHAATSQLVPTGARLVKVNAHALVVLDKHRVHRAQQPGDRVLLDVDGIKPLGEAGMGPGSRCPNRRTKPVPSPLVTTCSASATVRRPASASPGTARASASRSAMSASLPSSSVMMPERLRQAQGVARLAGIAPVAQRGEDVVTVGPQQRQPAQLVAGQQPGPRLDASGTV